MDERRASVVERATRLVEAIGAWLPHVIDPHAVTTEELALAGVARCRRLLAGMVKLHDDPDLAGVLTRTLFETWLSSIYLVLAEDDAYKRLESTDISLQRKLAVRMLTLPPDGSQRNARMREGAQAALDGPEGALGEFKVYDMAVAVAKLLKNADDPNAHYPTTMYTVSYGVESYVSTHGGLGAIKQHMVRDGLMGSEILTEPWNHSAHDHRLDLMSAAVLTLANRVGQLLALDTSGLEEAAQHWFGPGSVSPT
jgi:hypothetical protein